MNEPVGANTQALDAVRTEVKDIATNPQNPRYAGYQRNDPAVSIYIEGLYKRVVGSGTVSINEGLSLSASQRDAVKPVETPDRQPDQLSPEDAAAQASVDVMLRNTLGDDYDTVMRDMGRGAAHLFSGQEGVSALNVLSDRVTALGPQAEMLAVRFLADLSKLHTGRGV